MKRTLFNIIFFLAHFKVGQLYEYFDNAKYNSLGDVSWNYLGVKAMPVSWNIKFLCIDVEHLWIAIWILMLTYHIWSMLKHFVPAGAKGDMIKKIISFYMICLWMYMTYRAIDIGFWFYSFKTVKYYRIYWILLGIEFAVWYLWPSLKLAWKWIFKIRKP